MCEVRQTRFGRIQTLLQSISPLPIVGSLNIDVNESAGEGAYM
jgi:hypothetical protein